MRILVTGGAGYIGSHAVRRLQQDGHEVTVYDNLSCGHREAVSAEQLVVGDLLDGPLLSQTLKQRRIEAVMHFAALALVGESVTDPAKYYRNNVVGALTLFDAMRQADVWRFVFSSTTATYGEPEVMPITEKFRQDPINPYGFTKLVIEQTLADYAQAYGFGYVAFRYFNAAGASPSGDIGEDHQPESHLIPLVLQVALGQREQISIFGDDYPTPDGSCIRDYVHIDDLADAHARALERLQPGRGEAFNLGTGTGYSVLEVVEACRRVTGHKIPAVVGPRRAGDPPELRADASLAKEQLGWRPQYNAIEPIVETAWRWHQSHPHGYGAN